MIKNDCPVACLPVCLVGAYDHAHHIRPTDFINMAEHELDLASEGEIDLTAKEKLEINEYIAMLKRSLLKRKVKDKR